MLNLQNVLVIFYSLKMLKDWTQTETDTERHNNTLVELSIDYAKVLLRVNQTFRRR